MEIQRDFLTELADAREVDSMEMQAVVNRLPAKDWIKTSDLAIALDVAQSTIIDYVRRGDLRAMNFGTRDQPRYKMQRATVIQFLKRRFV